MTLKLSKSLHLFLAVLTLALIFPALASSTPAAKKPTDLLAALTPLPSGPGLVIADPVSDDPDTAAFGAGCTRWLFLFLGSQGQFGKTPPLDDIAHYLEFVHAPHFRLGPAHAKRIKKWMGITHLVTSRIEGKLPDSLTFTLTINSCDSGAAIGSPITVTGDAETIKRQLPATATQLSARLGVPHPVIESTVIEDVKTLQLIGRLPISSTGPVPTEYYAPGFSTRPPTPLLVLFDNVMGKVWDKQHPMPAAGVNIQLLHRFADRSPEAFKKCGPLVQQFRAKWPNNCNSHWLERRYGYVIGDIGMVVKACERGVRCNPGDPTGWAALAEAYGGQVNSITEANTSGDVEATLKTQYNRMNQAAWRGIRLNRDEPFAWHELALGAVGADNSQVALSAMWKCLALDPNNPVRYSTAFDIFPNSRWSDSDDRERLVIFTAKHPKAFVDMQSTVFSHLALNDWQSGDLRDTVDLIFDRHLASPNGWFGPGQESRRGEITRLWQAALDHPDDSKGWKDLTLTLHDWHTHFSRHWARPFSKEEGRMLSTLAGFWLLAAKRWTETEPVLKAWMEVSDAKAANQIYVPFEDDPHAHIYHLANNDPVALEKLMGHYSHIADMWGQLLHQVSQNRELWKKMAPVIANNFDNYRDHAESDNPIMDKWEKDAKAATVAQTDAGTGDAFFNEQAFYYFESVEDKPRILKAARNWSKTDYTNPWAHWFLANAIAEKDEKGAIPEYKEALRFKPDYAPFAWSLARVLNRTDAGAKEAETLSRTAVKDMPYDGQAWLQLGIALNHKKNYPEARDSLLHAISLGEGYSDHTPWVHYAFEMLQKNDKAWSSSAG